MFCKNQVVVAISSLNRQRTVDGDYVSPIQVNVGMRGKVQHVIPKKTRENQSTQNAIVVLWDNNVQMWVTEDQYYCLGSGSEGKVCWIA